MESDVREARRRTEETVTHRRQARETIRAGRLDELRGKSTATLTGEVGALLAKKDRGAFCATYVHRDVLAERGDLAARSTLAAWKKREEREMAADRDGAAVPFCLCEDGSVDQDSVRVMNKRLACCGGPRGRKISDVPTPTDRADCRAHDDVKLP